LESLKIVERSRLSQEAGFDYHLVKPVKPFKSCWHPSSSVPMSAFTGNRLEPPLDLGRHSYFWLYKNSKRSLSSCRVIVFSSPSGMIDIFEGSIASTFLLAMRTSASWLVRR
jgi:hypothetical protein